MVLLVGELVRLVNISKYTWENGNLVGGIIPRLRENWNLVSESLGNRESSLGNKDLGKAGTLTWGKTGARKVKDLG